jgi:hypothetical protein
MFTNDKNDVTSRLTSTVVGRRVAPCGGRTKHTPYTHSDPVTVVFKGKKNAAYQYHIHTNKGKQRRPDSHSNLGSNLSEFLAM